MREEHYESAASLIERSEFEYLALADTGLASLSGSAVVITMDYKLAQEISSQGGQAVNFNHLRGARLLPQPRSK